MYQHLHCSYNLNYVELVILKSYLTCCICLILTVLDTNILNSADVPLSNKQTNKQYSIPWYHRQLLSLHIGLEMLTSVMPKLHYIHRLTDSYTN